jgi:uncharacterized protein
MINPRGVRGRLLSAALGGGFTLISIARHESELRDVLTRPRLRGRYPIDEELLQLTLDRLRAAAIEFTPTDLPVICRDPKDDYLLACALAGGAHYLVSGDADLLALDRHPALGALRIVTAATFLDALDLQAGNVEEC